MSIEDLMKISENVKAEIRNISNIILSQLTQHLKVSVKGKSDFVTKYDIKIEQYLKEKLLKILPEASFLGEESGGSISNEYTWCVDPIDGTTNFIHGLEWAISVALLKNGETILGIVYSPISSNMYTAVKDNGATLNDCPIHVSKRDSINGAMTIFGWPYDENKTSLIVEKALKVKLAGAADVKRIGPSCLDICRVAAGKAELYFEYDLRPWDISAALLILQEAGGTLTNFEGVPIKITNKNNIVAFNSSKQLLDEFINA